MNRERDSKPLMESAGESPEVRSLLAFGAADEIDYDFERGLSHHLGAIGAALAPSGGTPGASAPTMTTSLSSKALLLLIGAPVAVASVVAALGLAVGVGKVPRLAESTDRERVEALVEIPVGPMAERLFVPLEESTVAERETGTLRARPNRRPPPARAPLVVQLSEQNEEMDRYKASSATTSVAAPRGERPVSARTAALVARSEEPSTPDLGEDEDAARKRAESSLAARRFADERLQREMAELVEAKRALADDPGRALLLARRGEHEFSRGVFSEERQHILILALLGLGRVDEARRTAAPYLERHPDSPFARRVRAALEAAAPSAH